MILMNRPALFLLTLATLGLVVYSVRSYLMVRSGEEDLDYLRRQVDQLQGKVTEQEGALAYYQSPEFVYQAALEQFGWTRPGEVIPVLSDLKDKGIEIEKEAETSSGGFAATVPLPNWKRWRTLFFEY